MSHPTPTLVRRAWSSAALAALAAAASAQGDASCLDTFIEAKMIEAQMPGMAAGIVRDGELVWAKGYGWANVELGLPATADTPFFLASVSKTVTGVALMQQRELGVFDLDDDVNDFLGFPVENPSHPGAPISFRQVMTHTSSIRDNWDVMDPLYVLGDSPLALRDYLKSYLAPGGTYYDPAKSYYGWAPGTDYSYCNIGFALAGRLVETTNGALAFDEYCRQTIFDPLGMDDTSFRLSDFDPDTLAMPYMYDSGAGAYVAWGHFGYPDYPAGTLRSSVKDLAKFLGAVQNDGSYGGAQILSPAAMAEMKTVQFPAIDADQGLTFYYWDVMGMTLLGHDGGDPGVTTDMYYRPADDVGVILLANSSAKLLPYYDIFFELFAFADQLAVETSRVGSPPNPDVLLPGVTSGPAIGATWDPVIDHAAFLPGAQLDALAVAAAPLNVPAPPYGTILCDVFSSPSALVSGPAGAPFAVPLPDACALLGVTLSAQGLSVDGSTVLLTNALDVTVGAF
jgi:CubicO group peptidase (beta-lactamase class C family)